MAKMDEDREPEVVSAAMKLEVQSLVEAQLAKWVKVLGLPALGVPVLSMVAEVESVPKTWGLTENSFVEATSSPIFSSAEQ